ncbi:MAG: hypothetical protein ACT4PI_09130 [Actinomycetota bacterium]
MSTIWTPSGEHDPEQSNEENEATEASGPVGEPGDPELEAELRRLREQLAATPVADIVANHAVGMWQLAIVHLAPEGDTPPNLDEARLAIDAMAALVEGMGDRLGDHETPLRDALAQLRLVFVQVSEGKVPNGEND